MTSREFGFAAAAGQELGMEAKLIEKNTFLQLETEQSAVDALADACCRRSRSFTDTLIEYGSSCRTSVNSSQLLEQPEVPEVPEPCSPSSHFASTEEEGDVEQRPHPNDTTSSLNTSALHANIGPLLSQHLFYYFLSWDNGLTLAQGPSCFFAPSAIADATGATSDTLTCAQLEARVAELHQAAAHLKAVARQMEAAVHGSADGVRERGLPSSSSPAKKQSKQRCAAPDQAQEPTTLMLRNIPNDYTRTMLLELLDEQGFAGQYDFVYLPIDFHRKYGFGYAFVNFVSYAQADLARLRLHGFNRWLIASQKICQVCWGEPLQGLPAHIERYRSSPVMHHDVPDEFKPIILQEGSRVPFPPPTRRVRAPRTKRGSYEHVQRV